MMRYNVIDYHYRDLINFDPADYKSLNRDYSNKPVTKQELESLLNQFGTIEFYLKLYNSEIQRYREKKWIKTGTAYNEIQTIFSGLPNQKPGTLNMNETIVFSFKDCEVVRPGGFRAYLPNLENLPFELINYLNDSFFDLHSGNANIKVLDNKHKITAEIELKYMFFAFIYGKLPKVKFKEIILH